VLVAIQNDIGESKVIEYEVASVQHAGEEMLDTGPRLAARCWPRLLLLALEEGGNSRAVEEQVLLHSVEETVCGLAHIEGDREVRSEAEPFVIERKANGPSSRPYKLDLAVAGFVVQLLS
jgi:hypothetical protein